MSYLTSMIPWDGNTALKVNDLTQDERGGRMMLELILLIGDSHKLASELTRQNHNLLKADDISSSENLELDELEIQALLAESHSVCERIIESIFKK